MTIRPNSRLSTMLVGTCLLGAVALAARSQDAGTDRSAASVRPSGLAQVFEPGWALRDENGDAQTDFVSARILMPRNATAEAAAAATAVAARLGLETSGLTFPLVFSPDEAPPDGDVPTIVIGTDNDRLRTGVRRSAPPSPSGSTRVTMNPRERKCAPLRNDTGVAPTPTV